MASEAIELRAHLMRRVGVGATRDELEALEDRPYEEIVEDLQAALDQFAAMSVDLRAPEAPE